MQKPWAYLVVIVIIIFACTKEKETDQISSQKNDIESGWTVPHEQLVLSENAFDEIQSIDNPYFQLLNPDNLRANEIAFVYRYGDVVKVYPKNILWHHEIVNDRIGDHYFAVTLCPLTGSTIAWNREINGEVTEFGVSGHLYNENLVPYDRNTKSFWSQMFMQGIKGKHAGVKLESEFLLTTNGETILKSFPGSMVLVDTSSDKFYSNGEDLNQRKKLKYIDNSKMGSINGDFFGIINFGISKDPEALLFGYDQFSGPISLYSTEYRNSKIIVVGSQTYQFVVAFEDKSGNPNIQYFPVQDDLPIIMTDNESNLYDITGVCVSGPLKGTRLTSPISYTAHPFAWELFFGQYIEYFE